MLTWQIPPQLTAPPLPNHPTSRTPGSWCSPATLADTPTAAPAGLRPEPHRQPYHQTKPRSGASGCRQLPDLITTNRTLLFLVLIYHPGRYPQPVAPAAASYTTLPAISRQETKQSSCRVLRPALY